MKAKEWLKSVRLTVCIESTYEDLGTKDPKPLYHVKAKDIYEAVEYNIYAEDMRAIKCYLKASPYGLHEVEKS